MDGNFIFVGVKVKEKLYNELEESKASMKQFFRDNNPQFLQVIRIGGDEFIGKMIESGASLDSFSNNLLNLKTMLKMIIPNFPIAEDTIKIYAHPSEAKKAFY